MHVGHLRSTIIGEFVCRLLEYANRDVKRVNHVADCGTQFGMLIQYLKEEYSLAEGGEVPDISDLTEFYKSAKGRFDADEAFKEKSRANVVKLQAGDGECREIWRLLCDVSRAEFEKVYKRLDVSVEECGESFYNDRIPPMLEEFEAAGLVSVEDASSSSLMCVLMFRK